MNIYTDTKLQTAKPYELINLLYEHLIQILEKTKEIFDEKSPSKYEKITTSLLHAQEIVSELINSLDMEKGGEISKNLFRLYEYVYWCLIQANIKKDKKFIIDAETIINDLKDAWQKLINEFKKNEKNDDNINSK
jgi:flagellar protein FliS